MNTQIEVIQSLIQLNRKALRELAGVADTTSADFVHIGKAQEALNEQFHILLQQKEELERAEAAIAETQESVTPRLSATPETDKEKRGRGAEKQQPSAPRRATTSKTSTPPITPCRKRSRGGMPSQTTTIFITPTSASIASTLLTFPMTYQAHTSHGVISTHR